MVTGLCCSTKDFMHCSGQRSSVAPPGDQGLTLAVELKGGVSWDASRFLPRPFCVHLFPLTLSVKAYFDSGSSGDNTKLERENLNDFQ